MFENFFRKPKRVAVFVDGPNMIRKGSKIDLAVVLSEVKKYGDPVIANVYLDQYASDKLIEAVINQGFSPVITSGDVDVTMATDSVFFATTRSDLTGIVFVTRDTDFVPAIKRCKEIGKEIIIIGIEHGFSAALRHYADHLILMK
ncbi:MAG: NYN domain-containing protein [Candidatus Anstonellales archaeon]